MAVKTGFFIKNRLYDYDMSFAVDLSLKRFLRSLTGLQ